MASRTIGGYWGQNNKVYARPQRMSKTIASLYPAFPQFKKLPAELRLMIWEQFALPKHPFIIQLVFEVGTLSAFASQDTLRQKDFWSISRVNTEARWAVLQGRQAVFDCRPDSHEDAASLFIDWKRDILEVKYMDSAQWWSWTSSQFRTYKANLQHLLVDMSYWYPPNPVLPPQDVDFQDMFTLDEFERSEEYLMRFIQQLPSLRRVTIRVGVEPYLSEYEHSGHIQALQLQTDRAHREDAMASTWAIVQEQIGTHSAGLPVTVESLEDYVGFPEDTSDRGKESLISMFKSFVEVLQRTKRSLQGLVSKRCGRPIEVKLIQLRPPPWAAIEKATRQVCARGLTNRASRGTTWR
ncbi:hypothetical protein F4808DRAFT_69975 [Astrocystis sublimbata]|nr:hypothetical protein F4808DRAFT_69975 [Astrocystis sublimbata]